MRPARGPFWQPDYQCSRALGCREASWVCEIAGASVKGPRETYAAAAPGELVLLISSSGSAEVAVRDGSAAERLHVRRGATVTIPDQLKQ